MSKVFAPGDMNDGNEKVSLKITVSVNMYCSEKNERECMHFDKVQSI